MKRLVIGISLLLLVLLWWGNRATSVSANIPDRVPGQLLVKFKDTTSPETVDRELRRYNTRVVDQVRQLGVLVVAVPEAALEKVLTALSKNPHVEYAEPDSIATVFSMPNDPYFIPNQWGFENTGQTIQCQAGTVDADIDVPTAWDTIQGLNVKVAVLDTGIDQNHEDISSKLAGNINFSDAQTVDDFYGHGTHVGGIVAAVTDNGVGVAGGCPGCLLLNVKVLNDSGSGAYSWIANGITYAADNGAKVINMSLGGSASSRTLERAVNYAWNKGVIVVAAAGNSANPSKTYPAAYTNAIAVAATDNRDRKASFSSYGAKWVDVAAPGVNIYSTFPNHPYKINNSLSYDFGSGTSMSTPMTAAVAALLWNTPYGTSASNVRTRLETTADKISGTGTYWSRGRVNAANAVAP